MTGKSKKFSLAGATAPTAESNIGTVKTPAPTPTTTAPAVELTATAFPSAPLSAFCPDPRNHRKTLGDLADLGARMSKHGQLQPVVAVSATKYRPKFPDVAAQVPDDVQFVVIMGGRRLAAAPLGEPPLADLRYTLADHLLDYDDYREACLDENWRRQDLTCLDEARLLAEFLAIDGTQQKVAERVGRSQPFVAQRLGLLDLVPEAHDAIDARLISFREARKLSPLTPNAQRAAVARLLRLAATEDEDAEPIAAPAPPAPRAPTRKAAAGMLTRYRQFHGPRGVAELLRDELEPEELAELVAALTESAESAESAVA